MSYFTVRMQYIYVGEGFAPDPNCMGKPIGVLAHVYLVSREPLRGRKVIGKEREREGRWTGKGRGKEEVMTYWLGLHGFQLTNLVNLQLTVPSW